MKDNIKRIALRLNIEKSEHRKVWEYIQQSNDSQNDVLIKAILDSYNHNEIREIINDSFSEIISNFDLSTKTSLDSKTTDQTIDHDAMDFINTL